MIGLIGKTVRTILNPAWVTGPIFEKELRVSSRRRRNYSLRVLYILLLTVFIAIVWLSVVESRGNTALEQSRMAVAGKRIVTTTVLFQFIVAQILAVIMLSTAISDEIYHRTLGLLMTTPINSFQIVMGKVLSRLLQLILLLAISLPMLAIVRVSGGVSWDYLLSSLCVTLTAAVFAGSLSLLLSISNRHAYGVIIRTVFVLGCFYFILPPLLAALWHFVLPKLGIVIDPQSRIFAVAVAILVNINPFFGISQMTQQMLSPVRVGVPYSWLLQSGIMLALSLLVLIRATAVVRNTALRQATGQLEVSSRTRRMRHKRSTSPSADVQPSRDNALKRVHGPPVVWRELRAPFIYGIDNRNSYIGLGITVLVLLLTYWSAAHGRILDEDFVHVCYAMLFLFLGIVINVVFAATRVTTERESQSLLLLLTTPLNDWQILLGKGVSVFRRCLPIWGLLAGHLLFFSLIGYIHPVAILHLAIVVAWLTCFLTGAGLYFSTRFARTTSSVVASFALALGLWAIGPMAIGLLAALSHRGSGLLRALWAHPAIQAEVIVAGAAGADNARRPWGSLAYGAEHILFHSGRDAIGVVGLTSMLMAVAAVYVFVGLLFLWRAKCHLRRNIL